MNRHTHATRMSGPYKVVAKMHSYLLYCIENYFVVNAHTDTDTSIIHGKVRRNIKIRGRNSCHQKYQESGIKHQHRTNKERTSWQCDVAVTY